MNRRTLLLASAAPVVALTIGAGRPGLRLRLPAATGSFPVGVRETSVSDPARIDDVTGRPRRIPIRVWYPATTRRGPRVPYFSPAVQTAFEQKFGLPAGLFDVDTHATLDARPRRHVSGILLVQHGGGTMAAFQTSHVIEMASHGYAVVTMEHPHESLLIEEADGTLIPGPDNADTVPFTDRLRDGDLVLAALPGLVPQSGPGTRIGMFGHSRGGAATADLMYRHPRISHGVILDGLPRTEVLTAGLDRPLGLIIGNEAPAEAYQPFLDVLRGPHPFRQLQIMHYGFTDFVVFNAQAPELEAILPTGVSGDPAAGRRAMADQRRFLRYVLSLR